MSDLFNTCFTILLGHEGGFVDNPADPGGATRYGIAQRSYPNVDIRNLTVEGAKAIYLRDFWAPMDCDTLPPPLALVVFDTAVNSGKGRARQFLTDNPTDWRAYLADRLQFFTDLGTFKTFGKGWSRRIAALMKQAAALDVTVKAAPVTVMLSQKGSAWLDVSGKRTDAPTVTVNATDPSKIFIRTK